jgi:hypothetical protein
MKIQILGKKMELWYFIVNEAYRGVSYYETPCRSWSIPMPTYDFNDSQIYESFDISFMVSLSVKNKTECQTNV